MKIKLLLWNTFVLKTKNYKKTKYIRTVIIGVSKRIELVKKRKTEKCMS